MVKKVIFSDKNLFLQEISGKGKILCLDYGKAKIGLATCDANRTITFPLPPLKRTNLNNDIGHIIKLLLDEKMVGLVIGLPLNMDGSQSLMVQRVKQFAHDILNKINIPQIPIYLQDERLSSFMAKDYIAENEDSIRAVLGKNHFKQNKEKIDSIAAKIILDDFLRS